MQPSRLWMSALNCQYQYHRVADDMRPCWRLRAHEAIAEKIDRARERCQASHNRAGCNQPCREKSAHIISSSRTRRALPPILGMTIARGPPLSTTLE